MMPKWSKNWPNNFSKYALGIENRLEKWNNILDFSWIALEINTTKKSDRLRWNAQLINATNVACYRESAHTTTKKHSFILWTERVRIQCCTEHHTFWFRGFQAPCFGPQHQQHVHGAQHTLSYAHSTNNIRHIYTHRHATYTHSLSHSLAVHIRKYLREPTTTTTATMMMTTTVTATAMATATTGNGQTTIQLYYSLTHTRIRAVDEIDVFTQLSILIRKKHRKLSVIWSHHACMCECVCASARACVCLNENLFCSVDFNRLPRVRCISLKTLLTSHSTGGAGKMNSFIEKHSMPF